MNVKKLIAVTTGAIAPLAFALPAFAQNIDPCQGSGSQFNKLCNLNAGNLGGIVGAGVTFLLIIAVVISLFYLVFGGIKWVTSGGDKAKVESARNHIIAAIIGLVIAFLSFFVLSLALSIFGLDIRKLELPRIPSL